MTTAGSFEDDFPLREEVEDFEGRTRVFEIRCEQVGLGYTVIADEEGMQGLGYQFSSHSETSPYAALWDVRKEMARALSTRHLRPWPHGGHVPTHDTLRGRVTRDEEGLCLVIDGIPLSLDELGRILDGCEGCAFRIDLVDRLADTSRLY